MLTSNDFNPAYGALPATAARLYRALGLHPSPEFSVMMAVAAVADTHAAAAGLEALSAAGLVTGADGRRPADLHVRYRMPPEVHAHATAAAEAYGTAEENTAVSHRICEFYLHGAQQAQRRLEPFRDSLSRDRAGDGEPLCISRSEALAWLDAEYPTIEALLWHPLTPSGVLIALTDALWPYWVLRGVTERVRQAHVRALEAARALGDQRSIGRMLTSGGLLAREVAPQQSHDLLTEAIELYEDAGDDVCAARSLHYLAHTELARGDRDGARHLWLRAVAELHRAGEARTAALALIEVAALDVADQRGSSAAALASSAIGVLRQVEDPFNAARGMVVWGQAEAALEHTERALSLLGPAIAALGQLGADKHAIEALAVLGGVHEQRYEHELALAAYQEALGYRKALEPEEGMAGRLRANIARLTPPGAAT